MGLDTETTARQRLLAELRQHGLVIGEVILTSGRSSHYLVDAKRAILRPRGFAALAELSPSKPGRGTPLPSAE